MNTTSIHKIKGWNKYSDPKETNIKHLFCKYQSSAKKRNLSFSLTFDQFRFIISENCAYCGVKPSKIHNRYLNFDGTKTWTAKKNNISEDRIRDGEIKFNGIDRRDNNLGYVIDNCVTCCYTCNQAKHDMSHAAFMSWLAKIVNHWNNS